MKLIMENWRKFINEGDNFFDNMRAKKERCKGKPKKGDCAEARPTKKQWKKITSENSEDIEEAADGHCPKCKQVVEGPMEEHMCNGETKKESSFSGNGPLGEPIEEKKKKGKKRKSSRCTRVTKKASSTRKGKKWMKCVKSDSGGYKRIHWGQAGVRVTGKSGNTKRKKSFKARHGCSTAKSNTPKGQACKDWAE